MEINLVAVFTPHQAIPQHMYQKQFCYKQTTHAHTRATDTHTNSLSLMHFCAFTHIQTP
jgi:hypothetical protein